MRIVHLYDEHQPVAEGTGSVSTAIYHLSRMQATLGHDVTVIERQWDGLAEIESMDNVSFKRFPLSLGSNTPGEDIPYKLVQSTWGCAKLASMSVEFAVRFLRLSKDLDFDVLHVHLPFAANFIVHLFPGFRDKMIYTAHVGEESHRLGSGISDLVPNPIDSVSPDIHLMKRVASSVVLNSKVEETVQRQGVNNVQRIGNGVDLSRFPLSESEVELIKEKYSLSGTVLMFAGSIVPRKGVDTLVSAFAELENNRELTLLVVGDQSVAPDYVDDIRQLVSSLNVTEKVKLTGYVPYDDLRGLYSASDIFVLPSREEGFGMVVTEALASGKPVVSTEVGGIPHQVEHAYNGYLVKPENTEELASHLSTLVKEPEKRRKMGSHSREIAENRFSWEQIASEYLDVYQEVTLS